MACLACSVHSCLPYLRVAHWAWTSAVDAVSDMARGGGDDCRGKGERGGWRRSVSDGCDGKNKRLVHASEGARKRSWLAAAPVSRLPRPSASGLVCKVRHRHTPPIGGSQLSLSTSLTQPWPCSPPGQTQTRSRTLSCDASTSSSGSAHLSVSS